MIRAVLKAGAVQLLDPIPIDWTDGQELRIEPSDDLNPTPQEIDEWYRELQQLGSIDPADRERMDSILREADEQTKQLVRRDMGRD